MNILIIIIIMYKILIIIIIMVIIVIILVIIMIIFVPVLVKVPKDYILVIIVIILVIILVIIMIIFVPVPVKVSKGGEGEAESAFGDPTVSYVPTTKLVLRRCFIISLPSFNHFAIVFGRIILSAIFCVYFWFVNKIFILKLSLQETFHRFSVG